MLIPRVVAVRHRSTNLALRQGVIAAGSTPPSLTVSTLITVKHGSPASQQTLPHWCQARVDQQASPTPTGRSHSSSGSSQNPTDSLKESGSRKKAAITSIPPRIRDPSQQTGFLNRRLRTPTSMPRLQLTTPGLHLVQCKQARATTHRRVVLIRGHKPIHIRR